MNFFILNKAKNYEFVLKEGNVLKEGPLYKPPIDYINQ